LTRQSSSSRRRLPVRNSRIWSRPQRNR
jgi:hypothetical protein